MAPEQTHTLRELLRWVNEAILARERAADALGQAHRLQQQADVAIAAVLLEVAAILDAGRDS
jgi:hypothetical protein